ncbi:FAD/NAD(P)-binding domain-containing protein [Cadophora sp. DSE1049]|nr:FAD/NAD(P)-binding domain-containing protein [Cadophora sp. DSE1049]
MNPSIRLENVKHAVVIGAGISGIVSAVHLLRTGINVTILERAQNFGGAWSYSSEPDEDPPFPSIRPPGPEWPDEEGVEGLNLEEITSFFAPRGPVYANMKCRSSSNIMRTSLLSWPEGTEDYMGHEKVLAYLLELARVYGLEESTRFHTQVESVAKRDCDGRWLVRSRELVTTPTNYTLKRQTSEFDTVVVATGRYNVPRVPDVPGLSAWKLEFPSRISHSKQYRTPDTFRGKTVLVMGGFISSMEITNELTSNGAKVYASARDTAFDFRDRVDHENVENVPMVTDFTTATDNRTRSVPGPRLMDDETPIPGKVILEDGRVLENIHYVIIATGYLLSYPFLGTVLQQTSTELQDADDRVIITADCRTVHNLHEDIFYIPDPTLAFIGVTHFASTFSLYDFQAQVLANVFAGRVRLPSKTAMEAEQKRRKSWVLPGTFLNSGFDPLQGPDSEWWGEFSVLREKSRSRLQKAQENYLRAYFGGVTSLS